MNKANTISDIGGVIKQESNKYVHVVYTLKSTPRLIQCHGLYPYYDLAY